MIGERTQACVVLPGERAHIAHSLTYFSDGITEKLEVFQLSSLEDLQILLKRYLYYVCLGSCLKRGIVFTFENVIIITILLINV